MKIQKYLAGEKDKPHDRAFMLNIACCIWTVINKPEEKKLENKIYFPKSKIRNRRSDKNGKI